MLNIRVTDETKRSLAEQAKAKNKTLSEFTRDLIKENLKPSSSLEISTLSHIIKADNFLKSALKKKKRALDAIEQISQDCKVKEAIALCEKYNTSELPDNYQEIVKLISETIDDLDPRLTFSIMKHDMVSFGHQFPSGDDFEAKKLMISKWAMVENRMMEELQIVRDLASQMNSNCNTIQTEIPGISRNTAWLIVTYCISDLKKAKTITSRAFADSLEEPGRMIKAHMANINQTLNSLNKF